MTLGQKIKEARLARGMTQKEVVGSYITRNMLSKIENDSATPSVRTLTYLANILGVPASEFLTDAALSDGSAPDGLDEARALYRAENYTACLESLGRNSSAASTDEGYLLQAYASAAAARDAFDKGKVTTGRELAEQGRYYNREGMYRAPHLELEFSLMLEESADRGTDMKMLEKLFHTAGDFKNAYRYATLARSNSE